MFQQFFAQNITSLECFPSHVLIEVSILQYEK